MKSKTLVAIGYYQIIGGIIGILMVVFVLFKINPTHSIIAFTFIVAILAFLFSIVCGVYLLKRNSDKAVIIASIINQLLQIPTFITSAFTYKFISGMGITLGWTFNSGHINLSANISNFLIEWGPNSSASFYLGVNLVAIFLVVLMFSFLTVAESEPRSTAA